MLPEGNKNKVEIRSETLKFFEREKSGDFNLLLKPFEVGCDDVKICSNSISFDSGTPDVVECVRGIYFIHLLLTFRRKRRNFFFTLVVPHHDGVEGKIWNLKWSHKNRWSAYSILTIFFLHWHALTLGSMVEAESFIDLGCECALPTSFFPRHNSSQFIAARR